MTVSTVVLSNQYAGNGSTDEFDFDFTIYDSDELIVNLIDEDGIATLQTLSTDYSIDGVGADGGGSIAFVTAPATGMTVDIRPVYELKQTASIKNQGRFLPEIHEGVFDKLTRFSQYVYRLAYQSLRLPDQDELQSGELGDVETRKGKYLFFDAVTGAVTYALNIVGTTLTQLVFNTFLDDSEQYKRTAGEISAGVTPTRYEFFPGDVRRYCSAGETNHTAAFAAAIASSDVNYWPAGTWNVDTVAINIAGRRINTDGFSTIIQQRSGNPAATRLILINKSNVILGDVQVRGNISTDTGEQYHGVCVLANEANISNIAIGNILAQDIRGDALALASQSTTGFTCSSITFGVVFFDNCYRNGVSIIGATYIVGNGVYCNGRCGYATVDIEPNGSGALSSDIYIGWVRGGVFQCAPPTAATMASRIHIGALDLNPAYQANSSPGYSEGGSSYALEIINAVWLRNCNGITFDYIRVRDHTNFAIKYIFNVGELRGRGIHIGYLDASGVGASEVTINALMDVANVETMTIDDGEVVLQAPTTDYVLIGSSATRANRFTVNRLRINGGLCRFSTNSRFSQIERNDTNNIVVLRDCDNAVLECSEITAPVFITACTGLTVTSTSVTCTGTYLNGTNTNVSFINCSGGIATDGILQGSATYDPASLADGEGVTTSVTVTGAALGDILTGYSFSLDLQDVSLTAYIQAANTVEFRFQNESGGVRDLGSGTLRAYVKKA